MALNSTEIRRQFPYLAHTIDNHPVVYLDGAATSQKPTIVLDAMRDFYETSNGNPHRGMHPLAERATAAYEGARETVRTFINAKLAEEIIFTKSTTESINLIARSLGSTFSGGDTVLVSVLEHHGNIVPWLQLKGEQKIKVEWIEIDAGGNINPETIDRTFDLHRPKLVALTGLSNVLGTAPDLKKIIESAHACNALVLVDAAQMSAHMPIDVQELDCDFLAFSGHKIYGPTGIGVLYGKKKLLERMPPFLGGGMMIREVTRDGFTAADLPAKFEAGTPPVAEAVGLAAAIDWQKKYDWKDRINHEASLLSLATDELSKIPGLSMLGPKKSADRHGCISFVIDDIHPHDLTDLLGQKGICLRAGHHCAQPLHERLGINASARLSVSIHTTKEEILAVRPAILAAMKVLQKP
jgi:cysteine desulfurase/selenocysteine lyase